MGYKQLISEYIKNQKYLIIIVSSFILTIFIGLIIINEMNLKNFIVLILLCLFFIGLHFYRKKQFNDIYKSLSKEQQKELDLDIEQTHFFLGKDYTLSSKYIINFKKPKIIKYSSILIIDKTTGLKSHGKFNLVCDIVYVFTKNEKIGLILKEHGTINLQSQDCAQYYEGLYSYIKAQNPNVLEGYTKKNREIIKNKYKIKI